MIDREQQLVLRATRMLNDFTPGSLIGLDYADQIKPMYDGIRDLFYRSDQSEWSLMKCYSFIREQNISSDHFILFLEELFNQRFSNSNFRNGKKGSSDFISRLKKSPKFKTKKVSKPRIKFLDQEQYSNFINDLRCFKHKYVENISQNKWIDLISKAFEMQNSPSTFRKDYHELRLKE